MYNLHFWVWYTFSCFKIINTYVKPFRHSVVLSAHIISGFLTSQRIINNARLKQPPRMAEMLDGDSCDDEQVLRRAHKRVLHWGAASWVASRNRNRSTPSTTAMIAQLELLRLAIPERLRPRSWRVCVPGALRAKASRLRATYDGRIGGLQVRGEYVTTHTP